MKIRSQIYESYKYKYDLELLSLRKCCSQNERKRWRKYIFVNSNNAYRAIPDRIAYSASKGSQLSMMRAMAQNLGKYNIRVNAVLPEMIRTYRPRLADQHTEYQRLLAEHNIIQSMSRKGNYMDNGAMENLFGRLKVEMFYGEKFESVNAFIDELKKYIYYYNNECISLKLKGMSPVQYRTHSQAI